MVLKDRNAYDKRIRKIKQLELDIMKIERDDYKKGYKAMSGLCNDMLRTMKHNLKTQFLFILIWFLLGLIWGIMIAKWVLL